MSKSIFSRALRAAALFLGCGFGLAGPSGVALAAASKTLNPYLVVEPKTFQYNTTGSVRTAVDPSSIKGPNQLSFSGVSSGVYATGSGQTIQLGQFVVTPTTTSSGVAAVTTYDGTPFVIQVRAPEYDKSSKIPVLSTLLPNFDKTFHLKTQTLNSLLIRGHLDGTVDPTTGSSVTATVDSVRPGSSTAPAKNTAVNYTFPVRYNDLKLPTSWTMSTAGTALATAAATPVGTIAAAAPGTSANSGSTAAAAQVLATPAAETLTADPIATPVPTPTPEPSTILIFAAGAAGVAYARRRRA